MQLADLAGRETVTGRGLMLGRQKFRYGLGSTKRKRTRHERHYRAALEKAGLSVQLEELVQADGYAEQMFAKMGFGRVETIDYSDYEFDANEGGILHDLNKPVPKELHNQFDFIFDGGTLEHVFNVPVALENVFKMLRKGGIFVGVNPLNGWPGHGIYQFSPELVYSFWVRKCGSLVEKCVGVSETPKKYYKVMPDPNDLTSRSKIGNKFLLFWRVIPRGKLYLYSEVRKTSDGMSEETVHQTSYIRRWGDDDIKAEATT
ncbi:class I SAM-dependent methyltransferase [Octadecabacter sp. G9-8]|uniref:Class I SAM-dependent methyltransferase n=1 Tax=Octadecabacter dasysiphoniae TaxID=2909341 RepID=A0ABS9CYZ7_9RHOB|nr:class I SAM-dependent methyltransferase [Octadecabacter dasysiphoniae]MCF2872126.1 class I SAM-dependent methyltransferase [Octadecabacter dasysiphoniae]